jgi:hypothetical protein
LRFFHRSVSLSVPTTPLAPRGCGLRLLESLPWIVDNYRRKFKRSKRDVA